VNRRKNSRLAALLAALPVLAGADVRLEQSVTVEARGLVSVFDGEQTLYTEISGDRARIERWEGVPARTRDESVIIDIDGHLRWELEPDDRVYTTVDLGEHRMRDARDIEAIAQMPQDGPDALPVTEANCRWDRIRVNIDRTGEKRQIAGVKAEQYLLTAEQTCAVPDTHQACDVTWVLDYWNARRMPGSREVGDFRRELGERIGAPELLALTPLVPRGLLALFEQGWIELAYETEALRGYPVRTLMSLHIGGKQCRNRSDQEITRDTVWSRVKEDSIQATKQSAAATAGQVVAGQVFQRTGGGLGGMIASTAADIFTRDTAARAMERDEKQQPPVQVGAESAHERIEGQVQIFRITTELRSINDEGLEPERFEVPPDWFEAKAP